MAELSDFERFDVVSDDSDHYFRHPKHNTNTKKQKHNQPATTSNNLESTNCAVQDCFTNAESMVHKNIMTEWKILSRGLPDSIYVRVYENRIDLMRAVIVGAASTPYHDGLFFFDIAFPPKFPNLPPKVRYHSRGFKLNPNLYRNGQVCLSLINTWLGNNNERWVPYDSTVLQLLVSLQGLVLNDTPFFNEAGSEILGRAVFEKKARSYNETVFALNCKAMLSLLQRPPLNFEGFVHAHFRSRACEILRACSYYVNGRVRVGWYSEVGECFGSRVKVSQEFNVLMLGLHPRLVVAFQRCGATLESCLEVLVMEKNDDNNGSSKKGHGGERKYRKIVRKVIGKIRKFYSIKKIRKFYAPEL